MRELLLNNRDSKPDFVVDGADAEETNEDFLSFKMKGC